MTNIELLNDSDFSNRVKLQIVVVSRKIIKNVNSTKEEIEFARRVLQNPNDGQRVSSFVVLILAGFDASTWEALTEVQKNTLIETEVRKVFKEVGYIKE